MAGWNSANATVILFRCIASDMFEWRVCVSFRLYKKLVFVCQTQMAEIHRNWALHRISHQPGQRLHFFPTCCEEFHAAKILTCWDNLLEIICTVFMFIANRCADSRELLWSYFVSAIDPTSQLHSSLRGFCTMIHQSWLQSSNPASLQMH